MMNPGPIEEVGATTRSMFDALKSTPAVLAILVFNITFMALIAWATHEQGDRWERTVQTAFKYCPSMPAPQGQPKQQMQLQSDESRPVELPKKE